MFSLANKRTLDLITTCENAQLRKVANSETTADVKSPKLKKWY